MPVPWFLLSLALGRSPAVLSLERLSGTQDTVHCSPGLSCHLWDGDLLCVPGSLMPAPGPVLVPARLQTELVLRCYQEQDCDLCLRVAIHLAVHGLPEGPDQDLYGTDAELKPEENGSLQAQVVLYFRAYAASRCVLMEVQVPAALVHPGRPAGSVVFECLEVALGAEVRIWAYTQPRYQKELNLTQQLPDCRSLEVRDSIENCKALPWLDVATDGEDVLLHVDISEGQRVGLSLYWNQSQGPTRPWWHQNLTGPQTISLNHTDLVPCLCVQTPGHPRRGCSRQGANRATGASLARVTLGPVSFQVWPLEPDSVRTSLCPFREDPRAHRNLWHGARLRLLPPQSWRLEARCPMPAEASLCWQPPGGDTCQPLTPLLPRENVTVNKALEFPLLNGHPNLCVQVHSAEKLQLQDCLWADSLRPPRDDVLLLEVQGARENRSFCALEPGGCTPVLSRAPTRAARLGEQLLRDLHSGQCLKLWDGDLETLWACPMDKYMHQRWVLLWLAGLLLAAVLFLLLLLQKGRVKAAARGRRALLLHAADDAAFERLVGALASALGRLPLRVAVDLWSGRELGALGPAAWVHAQRRLAMQEGGVVVLLFSPAAAALCREWLQDGAPGAHGPPGTHDAFAASLSCVLPDFLQGRAAGRYVSACFDGLLPPAAVPAPLHAAPLFSLPAQLPEFLGALQGRDAPGPARLRESARQVARALRPALERCSRPPPDPSPAAPADPE
ncbi:interleukin-17 receptor C isoform X3 [Erinaceus europaeus]|uniref:Interleukin-17 receptor C isoform X3 n=1 Tax=Erinaceus europaeus TaxID=9365 RepID=A0ABM3WJG7_ERIEU|nr:interleukin-17 receptor C isoform X3 [Erinaceus europaeus]